MDDWHTKDRNIGLCVRLNMIKLLTGPSSFQYFHFRFAMKIEQSCAYFILPCAQFILCSLSAVSGSRVLDSKACMREMSVCIPQNYSKYSLPNDGQTIISLGVDIRDIPKIDDNDFIITITAYLSIQWTDPRLIIDEERFKEISGNRSWTPVEKHFFNELWLPDVEILNLKDLETKDVFAKLERCLT